MYRKRLARIGVGLAAGLGAGLAAGEAVTRRQQPPPPAPAPGLASAATTALAQLPALKQFEAQLAADHEADRHGHSAAITYAICRGGKVLHTRSYGWRDKDVGVRADAATIFRCGSIGKTFTAVVCLRLVEEGLLSLDDKVEKFVPEVKGLRGYADHPPITVRQILTVRQPCPRLLPRCRTP